MTASRPLEPGSPREILGISWPIGVSMLSMTFKGLIDMAMVGALGTEALAAVGFGSVVAYNALAFGMGVLRGQKSLVAQHLGAGDRRTSFSFGVHAFYLALLFAAVCVFLAPWAGRGISFLAGRAHLSGEAARMASVYVTWRLGLGGIWLVALSIAEYLRATGRTRLPMASDLIVHPLNILFNWLLIFGNLGAPRLGVAGSAIGTGLADLVSLLLLLVLARPAGGRLPRGSFRFYGRRLARAWSVGVASGVQFTLEMVGFTIITWFVAFLGTTALAAHQAALAILHVSFLPGLAIGDGVAVVVGREVGARRWDAARRAVRSGVKLALPLMVGMGLVFFLFGGVFCSFFLKSDDPEVRARSIALGGAILKVAAVWQVFDALQIVYRLALRAAGDHRWVMMVGILCSWLLSVPLAAFVVFGVGGSVVGVWAIWTVELSTGAWFFVRRWRRGTWIQKRLVEEEEEVLAASALPRLGPEGLG